VFIDLKTELNIKLVFSWNKLSV